MSSFLPLTVKSSKKSAFLWKGVLDPRKHVWRDLNISKWDMHVSSQDMALAYDSPLFRESLSATLLRKSLHVFPIPPFVPKPTGRGGGVGKERSHLHDHNSLLVLPFLLFLILHEDRFFGFVLVTCLVQMYNIYNGRIMFLLVTRNFLPLCPV